MPRLDLGDDVCHILERGIPMGYWFYSGSVSKPLTTICVGATRTALAHIVGFDALALVNAGPTGVNLSILREVRGISVYVPL